MALSLGDQKIRHKYPLKSANAAVKIFFAWDCHVLCMTGPYNFQTKMAVLNCPTHNFRIKLGSLRVRLRVVRVVYGIMVSIRVSFVNRAIFPPQ